jgi:hypothetical protein
MATPTNLPASFVSGNILTALQMNDLRGAFRVLQVKTATTDAIATNSTMTLADTNLTISITPQSTSSKILIYAVQNGVYKSAVSNGSGATLALVRGATVLTYFATGTLYTATALELVGSSSVAFLDSPATTSATTYKTQFANRVAANFVQVQYSSGVGTPTSYIVAMEISA